MKTMILQHVGKRGHIKGKEEESLLNRVMKMSRVWKVMQKIKEKDSIDNVIGLASVLILKERENNLQESECVGCQEVMIEREDSLEERKTLTEKDSLKDHMEVERVPTSLSS